MDYALRDIKWGGHTYQVEEDPDSGTSTIFDGGDQLFEVDRIDWTTEQLEALIGVYYAGKDSGKTAGRISLQFDLRRLLGAAALGDS